VLASILIASSLLVVRQLNDGLRQLTRVSLTGILSANTATTRLWLDQRREEIVKLASQPKVLQSSRELLERYGDQDEVQLSQLIADESLRTLADSLESVLALHDQIGWVLLDSSGRVIGSSQERLLAIKLPIPSEVAKKVDRGVATVCYAIESPVPVTATGPQSRGGAPVMLSMAPIATGVATLGSLALLIDPTADFSKLLSVARTGRTCETYAFNREGQLVSQSRFEDQMRQFGMLSSEKNETSILRISIRDPGNDVTRTGRPMLAQNDRPLTIMAMSATLGVSDENLEGYRDYFGVPVVGAWRWIEEYDIGVATEIDVDEAFESIQQLRQRGFLLLLLAGLAMIGTAIGASKYQRMHERSLLSGPRLRNLGQYSIGERIGSGGMGTVYMGQHQLLRRNVAVKVLEGPAISPRAISRFEREVQATAKLRHPNTVSIYDYGRTESGEFFYVMEWVDGITLQQLVNEYGRQPPERVIYLLLQVCGSLSEAHQKGIVHRDIKPANIMVTAESGLYDSVKLLDFGLVKEVDCENTLLTVTDSFTGTPSYMSPEAVRDATKVDHRSDIYSLGAVGYTLLAGVPVFEGGTAVDVCVKQLNEEPIRPSERIGERLPDDLQNVLLSCLRKFPEERPRTVDELAETLQHCADSTRWSFGEARRWWEQVYRASQTVDTQPNDDDTLNTLDPIHNAGQRDFMKKLPLASEQTRAR
jgi:serine/threonine protein kinase